MPSHLTTMPDDAPTDESLIARAAEGDRGAFDVLAGRFGLRLRRAALRVLNDPAAAEDVAQDALLRAWTRASTYRPDQASVSAWLHRIAVNAAIDRLRATRPSTEIPDDLADAGPSMELALAGRQRHAALRHAIASLPDRQRAAIAMTYGHGWSGQRAAEALKVSARALEGLLHRSRKALRAILTETDV
jgi:RNA polymerase sigma-70 factor (ECF subfamily)